VAITAGLSGTDFAPWETMTQDTAGPSSRPLSPHRLFGQPKMAALLILGFSSGLPLFLTSRTLQAWMTIENVDLTTIGLFSLVGLPYSLKFIWAPFIDRFIPPLLGRRRGWILIAQVMLMLMIGWMSMRDPQRGLQLLAFNALMIAFFSATQDVAIDAYRADVLDEREMAGGAAIYVVGYRIALIVAGSVAFILADRIAWPATYLVLSGLMLIGIIGSFRAPEPKMYETPPRSFRDAVYLPFAEFFTRAGVGKGFAVLLFIILYKLSDSLAQNMATPFLLDTGFSQTDIGAIAGGLGLGATIVGALVGGAIAGRIGINRSLWVFGGLQAVSNLMYYFLSLVGKSYPFLVSTMLVENFCTGLVTAGFLAFLMSMCSVRFSATQFALLSSLMAASRDIIVAPAGGIADATGWPSFFLITLAAGIPGLLLLPVFAPWNADRPTVAATHTGETVDPRDALESARKGED
jgi:PAT family beta-lactamase induction signal transducer AmpG